MTLGRSGNGAHIWSWRSVRRCCITQGNEACVVSFIAVTRASRHGA